MLPSTDIAIDTFRPEHAPAFAELNRAWLVAYGLLEPPDEAQLADPWGQVVAPGGQIFVALRGQNLVGTCAVVPCAPGIMELAKLAVAPTAQGMGLGRQLIKACLRYASESGVRRVVLLSNSRLRAALRLYEELGFQHRPMPPNLEYQTADVYMELDLPAS
jgi:ribosomal protein S18 acetylase RimI-like enzyme